MEASIRPLRDGELEAVIALWDRCDLLRPWNDPAADIALCRATPGSEIFVAEEDGALAASIMCGTDGHRGWMYYLAVEPGRRRGGLGSRLVRHAEAWLRGQGLRKAELMIRAENAPVRRFYESAGYAEEDRVVMSRWLDADE